MIVIRNLKHIYIIYHIILHFYGTRVKAETKPLMLPVSLPASTAPAISPAAKVQETSYTATTPAGIFDINSQPFYNIFYTHDYSDFYIPSLSSAVQDHFSWRLLRQVLAEKTNVIVSPFSVKIILAMLAEAAGNNTQTQRELIKTLEVFKSPENVSAFCKKLLTSLSEETPYTTLNLNTKMFTDAYIRPTQGYAAKLANFYNTDIESLDFKDTKASANRINGWCSNVTYGKLQHLVSQENIQNAVLLLANVIYFNGLWRHQFKHTYEGVFFTTPKTQCRAQYMQLTEHFYYYESSSKDAKILRLPYKGNKFAMFILLKKTKGNVEELLKDLHNDEIKSMQFMMKETKLKVTLPKFKFEFDNNLKKTLSRLGIHDIFTDNASLPGLDADHEAAARFKVSDVIQKAGIYVNEKGSEAYASTVFEIANKFGGNPVIQEFTVNRPFIFFIEDEATGSILFAGKVLKPVL